MVTEFIHVVGGAVWFGTAMTLPFWGRRMNRAANLDTVLGIIDTVYVLKIALIMGGLAVTLVTGLLLSRQLSFPSLSFADPFSWLAVAECLSIVILANSVTLLVFMTKGRNGRRSYYRYVPAIGYNNIALLLLVYVQMTVRPSVQQQALLCLLPLSILLLADMAFVISKVRQRRKLTGLGPEAYVQMYFGLLKEEKMTDFFRLFRDDAVFNDPFATTTVRGIKAIERFFQKLGDQFESIEITPVTVTGGKSEIFSEWVASGKTKNGESMKELRGTNRMQLTKGRISQIDIDFKLSELPRIVRVSV